MIIFISALVIVTSGIYILAIGAVVCFFLFYTEVSTDYFLPLWHYPKIHSHDKLQLHNYSKSSLPRE